MPSGGIVLNGPIEGGVQLTPPPVSTPLAFMPSANSVGFPAAGAFAGSECPAAHTDHDRNSDQSFHLDSLSLGFVVELKEPLAGVALPPLRRFARKSVHVHAAPAFNASCTSTAPSFMSFKRSIMAEASMLDSPASGLPNIFWARVSRLRTPRPLIRPASCRA